MRTIKVYLAAPYSHPDIQVRDARVHQVNLAAADLIRAGFIVFSPLSHSHAIGEIMGNSMDHGCWLEQDRAFIEWADALIVLKLSGYLDSYGVRWEVDLASKLKKPVSMIDPGSRVQIKKVYARIRSALAEGTQPSPARSGEAV